MTAGTGTRWSRKRFARHAMAGALLASTTACVIIVRNLEIASIEPAQVAAILDGPDSNRSHGGVKQAVKLQYEDGTSVLFRGSVLLSGDTLAGNALRASPDVLKGPVAVRRIPRKGIVGAVIFREHTSAVGSVAASAVGTAAALAVVGFLALSIGDAFDRAVGEALGCALGGTTCSLSTSRWIAPPPHEPRVRGGGVRPPASDLRSPGQPQRGRHR